jgi:hypothetical protein
MDVKLPDPPLNEGFPVFGNVVSNTEFQGVVSHGLFKTIVPDPRRLEGQLAKYNPELSGVADLRSRVQRLVTGAKRQNIEPYARYIIETVKTSEGFAPQIVLWCPQELRVEIDKNTGFAWALVPHELKFVSLDGDTQTAARALADGTHPGVLDKERVKVVIRHGISELVAQQIFADCNTKGVKVSTSMAIGLDNRDDATQLAKFVESQVPQLKGKVNRQKRQLKSTDPDLLTISALRASVVCFMEGINGVQNQTKAVELDGDKLARYRVASVAWFRSATTALDSALSQSERTKTFASSPSVWCAIGALGHDTLVELTGENFERFATQAAIEHALEAAAKSKLANVDWSRGDHWLAVGAKKGHSDNISLGGPKETGSLVYNAHKEGFPQPWPSVAAKDGVLQPWPAVATG